MAEDEPDNGTKVALTTECGTATPDGGTNPTDVDGLDPMGALMHQWVFVGTILWPGN